MMHAFSSDRFKLPARLFYCKIFRIGDVSARPRLLSFAYQPKLGFYIF